MNPSFAQQVSSILDKSKLNDRDIRSGMFDSVIELAVQEMTKERVSSMNDARHIHKEERKESLYSTEQQNLQPLVPQQQSVQLTEEQIKQFEEQKAKYAQMLQEQQMKSNDLRSRIESRRGKR